jgi:hypothetical protein
VNLQRNLNGIPNPAIVWDCDPSILVYLVAHLAIPLFGEEELSQMATLFSRGVRVSE